MAIDPNYHPETPRTTPNRRPNMAGWIIGILVAVGLVWGIAALWSDDRSDLPTAAQDPMGSGTPMAIPQAADPYADPYATERELGSAIPSDPAASGVNPADVMVITEQDDIESDPERYVGRQVVVEGDVDETLTPRLIKVDTDGAIGGDDVLVVIEPNTAVTDDQRVRVQGEVQMHTRQELEALVGSFDEAFFGDRESRPVIIASSVADAPR